MATLARPLAVITGASSGIGFELARQFAQRGHDLVARAAQPRIEGAAEELRQYGGRVEVVQADLATREGCEEINIVELNCVDTVRVAKWAARKMVAQGRGRMLVTASVAGIMPTPLEAVYGASKAFTLSFAASLHHELEDHGVTVTALMPGPRHRVLRARALRRHQGGGEVEGE